MNPSLAVPSLVISAKAASMACAAAMARAEALGIRINVAVTDASGGVDLFSLSKVTVGDRALA